MVAGSQEQQVNKLQWESAFQVSAWVPFASVLFAEASHMAGPRPVWKGEGTMKGIWKQTEPLLQLIYQTIISVSVCKERMT